MKIILFLLVILTSTKVYSQVMIFQAQFTSIAKTDETTGLITGWGADLPLDITIVLDGDKGNITLNFQNKRIYKILSQHEKNTGYDTGVKWTSFGFNCIDNEGLEAIITFRMYDTGPHLMHIVYDNVVYKIQMKQIVF